jgi:hypothetical protein
VGLEELTWPALVAEVARWCGPWQSAYSDSKVLETTVTGGHILATMIGGGFAIAADRRTLQALRRPGGVDATTLQELHAIHRPVIVGLIVLFVTGVALAAADVKTFAASAVFLAKLILVVLLCINGAFLVHTEHLLRRHPFGGGGPPPPRTLTLRLALASWLSITLWVATVVVGTALMNI